MTDTYNDEHELDIDAENEPADEISFEETDAEGVAVSQADKLKKLRGDLATAKKESMENLTGWQKERAEFINFKKAESERTSAIKERAIEGIVFDVLAVADSFDMAMGNKDAWEKVDANWRMGVEYIYQQLMKTLSENGVTEIVVNVGDAFNHDIHEPVETVVTYDQSQDDTIAKVVQKGYKKGEKVLRPVKVNVYNA